MANEIWFVLGVTLGILPMGVSMARCQLDVLARRMWWRTHWWWNAIGRYCLMYGMLSASSASRYRCANYVGHLTQRTTIMLTVNSGQVPSGKFGKNFAGSVRRSKWTLEKVKCFHWHPTEGQYCIGILYLTIAAFAGQYTLQFDGHQLSFRSERAGVYIRRGW